MLANYDVSKHVFVGTRVDRHESDLPLELREVIGAARAEIESRFLALDNALGPMAGTDLIK